MSQRLSELFEQDDYPDKALALFESIFGADVASNTRETLDTSLSGDAFSARYHFILNKQDEIVPFIYNPIQRHMETAITHFDLIVKPRQVGISTWVLSRIHHKALDSTLRARVFLDKDDNTANAREIMRRYHDYLPTDVIAPKRTADSGIRMQFDNDSMVTLNTAGAKASGRSSTNRMIFFDEAAYYSDLASLMRGAMQAGSPEWVVIASTANGAQGLFYEMCMTALKDPANSKWKLHFYEWWWEPEYAIALHPDEALSYSDTELELMRKHKLTAEQIKWRREKIREFNGDEASFLQEYPEDPISCFLTSGNAFFIFKPDTFSAPVKDLASGQAVGTFYSTVPYDETHTYVAGADFGLKDDFTVLVVIDIDTNEQVAYYRQNRKDPDALFEDIVNVLAEYRVKSFVPEINSIEMGGLSTIRRLLASRNVGTSVSAFRTMDINKMPMLNALNKAINDGLKLMDIPVLEGEFRSVLKKQSLTNQWQAVDSTGHTPDSVMAAGLAVKAASQYIW